MEEKSAEKGQRLGTYLASLRAAKGLTLRDVEEATDRDISNAYLSQLEHGRITRPSPNILHRLASVYGVSYANLMEKAGYIVERKETNAGRKHGRIATFAVDDLTTAEEEALVEYLAFLRSRKRR
jgi:transcriptional regulator with XRE-family HTH domain